MEKRTVPDDDCESCHNADLCFRKLVFGEWKKCPLGYPTRKTKKKERKR